MPVAKMAGQQKEWTEEVPAFAELWARAHAGDPASRAQLSHRATPLFERTLSQRRVHRDLRADVLSEGMASFLRFLDGNPTPPRDFEGFLRFRVRKVLKDRGRARERDAKMQNDGEMEALADPGASRPYDDLFREERLQALAECLGNLPDLLRDLVRSVCLQGQKQKEVAGTLKRSQGWVSSKLLGAFQLLRTCLERKGFES